MVMGQGSSSRRQGNVVMTMQKIKTKDKAPGLGVKGHKSLDLKFFDLVLCQGSLEQNSPISQHIMY